MDISLIVSPLFRLSDFHQCYCSRVAQTATDFADASHSKSAKSATIPVSYGIFSSENAYPCAVTILFSLIFLFNKISSCFLSSLQVFSLF